MFISFCETTQLFGCLDQFLSCTVHGGSEVNCMYQYMVIGQ
jgi:hypothetical protein